MSRPKMMPVWELNIAANPHQAGTYLHLLKDASRKIVKSRSHDAAMITRPVIENRRYFIGRILVWTELDLDGPWLDIDNEDKLSELLKKNISIPQNAKPNYRTFDYVFVDDTHRLFLEAKNEFNQTIGAKTARNLFYRLMQRDIQGPRAPDVEVTVVPHRLAVGRVLGLSGLKTLTIRVVRPNPDETSTEKKRRVFQSMSAKNVQRQEIILSKSSDAKAILPDSEVRDLAEVAAENGYVRGEGRQNGKKILASTDEFPQQYFVERQEGESVLSRFSRIFTAGRR